jgi:hypothetical protein
VGSTPTSGIETDRGATRIRYALQYDALLTDSRPAVEREGRSLAWMRSPARRLANKTEEDESAGKSSV